MRNIAEIDEEIRRLKEERESVLAARQSADLAKYKEMYDGRWVVEYDITPMKNYALCSKIPEQKTLYHVAEVIEFNPNLGIVVCRADAKIRLAARIADHVKEIGLSVISVPNFRFGLTEIERGFVEVLDRDSLKREVDEFKAALEDDIDVIETLVEQK